MFLEDRKIETSPGFYVSYPESERRNLVKISRDIFFVLVFFFIVLLPLQKVFSQESPRLIPVEDFFRNPQSALYQISPDGKYISYEKSYKNRLNIFVRERSSGKEKRVTSVTDRDILDHNWKGNEYLVYLKDFGGDENYHLFRVNRKSKDFKDLTPFPGAKTEIINWLADNDTDIIIGLNKRNPEYFDAYKLNIATGKLEFISENPGNIVQWPRVNINESNQIVDALRKRGVPVIYIVKENKGHGFVNQENRFDFYRAMEEFFAKYLK